MKGSNFWIAMGAGLFGGIVAIWLFNGVEAFAQKTKEHKKVVTAEDFHLVDQEGKLRGALFVSGKGEPGFALFDKEGKDRILLMLNADGSTQIDLLDPSGESRASLSLAKDGSPGLKLVGDPTVALLNRDGKPIWRAP